MRGHVVHPAMRKLTRRNVSCGKFVFFKLVGMGNRPVIVRCGMHVNSPRARDIVLHVGDSLMSLLRNITRNGLGRHALRFSRHDTIYIVLISNNCPRTCRGKFPVANVRRMRSDVMFRTNATLGSERIMATKNHIVTMDSCKGSGRRTLGRSFRRTRGVRFRGGCFHSSVKLSLWGALFFNVEEGEFRGGITANDFALPITSFFTALL